MTLPLVQTTPPTLTPPTAKERAGAAVRLWIELFDRHQILTNASAISFQALKALVPLSLFGITLPGVLGFSDVWDDQLRERVALQFTPTVFVAIDTAVEKIVTEGSPALPLFAGALLLWYVSGLVRASMGAVNSIYEADENRTLVRRSSLSFALAVCLTVTVVSAVFAVTVGPRIERSGASHVLLLVARWPFAVVALGLGVGLLVRYGPAERRQARWASGGAVAVVAAWIVQSLLSPGMSARSPTSPPRAAPSPCFSSLRPFCTRPRSSSWWASRSTSSCARMRVPVRKGSSACCVAG